MASLSLKHASKIYPGGVKAVGDFSLDAEDGEFVVIVGPSGCGKTSVLRMIAGLDELSSGELYIDGMRMTDTEPRLRDIAMVFQNFALFPHMTVFDNLALGLTLRHAPADEINSRVNEAAEMLGITHLLGRKASKLSGGEKQRVAIGRAIVRCPKVFLLDEPLSNLDARLRVQMRLEIARLHHKLGTTFVYVTHDQTEAMTMGERIVVMKDGNIRQVDTPTALYDRPNDLFVACFLGSPQMNIFDARLVEEDGKLYALIGNDTKLRVPDSKAVRITDKSRIGGDVKLGIRPEDIHYEQAFVDAYPECVVYGAVDVVECLGNENIVYLNVDGKDDYTVMRMDSRFAVAQGKKLKLCFAPEKLHLFDPITEKSLTAVPKYNKFAATASAKDGKLLLKFDGGEIVLDGDSVRRITDETLLGKSVTVGISPEALRVNGKGCDGSISGKIEFFERFTNTKALYISVNGTDGYFIAVVPADAEIADGGDVTLYFSTSDVALFDGNGVQITARLPIAGNVGRCSVAVGGDKTVYTLIDERGKKTKLAYRGAPTVRGNADITSMYIDMHGVTADEAAVKANGKGVLCGRVASVDELEGATVVTAVVNGMDEPFTAVLGASVRCSAGDKIKLAVPQSAIVLERYKGLTERVADTKNG